MINGDVISQGWTSPAVHEALDLCLSCKGCARDCPTGIDMAAYKSEVLDRTYRGRLRPSFPLRAGLVTTLGTLDHPLFRVVHGDQHHHRDARAAPLGAVERRS